jgi:hypothetical protein
MKRIELLKTECMIQGQTLELDYRTQLMGFIEEPPGGATIVEQRKIGRVHDALNDALDKDGDESHVLLEDADHETLCKILNEIKFKVYSKEILAMLESVLDAPNELP